MWWIQSVYVKPEYRGQGIFKRLYNHVKQQAKNAGAGRHTSAALVIFCKDDMSLRVTIILH